MKTKITKKMADGIKDTLAIIIAENQGAEPKEVREWLDTVKTAEDFFGTNRQGLAEYNSFISAKENEYNRAVRNSQKNI